MRNATFFAFDTVALGMCVELTRVAERKCCRCFLGLRLWESARSVLR